jgi:hypothetical protein
MMMFNSIENRTDLWFIGLGDFNKKSKVEIKKATFKVALGKHRNAISCLALL